MNLKKQFAMLAMSTLAASCWAQAASTVVAQFGNSPDAGQAFSVNLASAGSDQEISGFAFKVIFDPSQVSLTGVKDNTNQPAAKVQYTMGPVVASEGGTTASVVLVASTVKNLKAGSNLAELQFAKQAGYAAPFVFGVEDRLVARGVVDGLLNADLVNIPHTFDATQVNK